MNSLPRSLPRTWRTALLGDVLDSIDAGKSFSAQQRPAEPNEWGVLKISSVTWGEFQPQENKALLPGTDPGRVPSVRAGDLLITRANTTELVGAVAIAKQDYPQLLLSDKTLRLNLNPSLADSKYLMYVLRTADSRKHIESHATGTSGSMRNITQVNIRNTPIPLPPLEEQRRIAAILDRADALRWKRQEAIRLTEELLRSSFLEMFGDPVTNPKGWNEVSLGSQVLELRYGTSTKCSDVRESNSYPVLRIPNIVSGDISWDDLKYASLDQKEVQKLLLSKGDILFVRTNGNPEYIGRCAVYEGTSDSLYASYLIRARLRQDALLHSSFVCDLISFPTYRELLVQEARTTAGNYNINTDGLGRLRLIVPSASLQEHYLTLKQSISNRNRVQHGHLESCHSLFNSLLQRAFQGGL